MTGPDVMRVSDAVFDEFNRLAERRLRETMSPAERARAEESDAWHQATKKAVRSVSTDPRPATAARRRGPRTFQALEARPRQTKLSRAILRSLPPRRHRFVQLGAYMHALIKRHARHADIYAKLAADALERQQSQQEPANG